MPFRFTIGRKIGLGFAVLVITTLVIFVITYDTLSTGRQINDRINQSYNPSVAALEQLKSTLLRSRTLITMWAFVQSREDTKEKLALVNIINEELPAIKYGIDTLSYEWTENERRKKEAIYKDIEKLLGMYSVVQTTLSDMRAYDDPFARFQMTDYAEEDGKIYNQARAVIEKLDELIAEQQANTREESISMISSFNQLAFYLRFFGIALFVGGTIIAVITVRNITKPVNRLKHVLLDLGKGKFPKTVIVKGEDEIGEMSGALDQLVDSLKRTTEFASEVGKGNFETNFEPLSEEDDLGNALLVMRSGLKEYEKEKVKYEQELESEVRERTKELEKKTSKIEKQSALQKELLEDIRASIRYAKRLQDNIMPPTSKIKQMLPNSFIFLKPKDIVSGDFYYVKKVDEKVVFAAVDCTGHGVPGAFMSLVGHNSLNHAVSNNPDLDPGKILRDLSSFSATALHRSSDDQGSRDGMDLALCVYDPKNGVIEYAGAFNPLYLVRDKKLYETKADKIAVGSPENLDKEFHTHRVELQQDDMIYIFSDGYVDQFGGKSGRKFMYKPFREMLISISQLTHEEQHEKVERTMENWRLTEKGFEEQVDDMLIIGVRHKSV
jgi:serine phosphatase RsbU (regulator of sigma subunit)/HAMP domain-containing protein